MLINGKNIWKFKADNKSENFPTQFCLRSISEKFEKVESSELSFKLNVYDFSVNYDAFDESDILCIHKYLMVKNKIKKCLDLL